jgi:hypothetical protein
MPSSPDAIYMRHRAVLKLAVQIGVIEFVHRHPALATPVAAIAAALRDELRGEAHDMGFLMTVVQHKLSMSALPPIEQLLVLNLVEALAQTMRDYFIAQDIVPSQVSLRLGDVFDWISQAAAIEMSR